MNWLRYALIAGMCAVSYLLFLEWNKFEQAQIAANPVSEETLVSEAISPNEIAVDALMPSPTVADDAANDLPSVSTSDPVPEANELAPEARLISVKTDSFDLLIDTFGGDLVRVALNKYLAEQKEGSDPFLLMNRSTVNTYIAQSGLVGQNGTDKSSSQRPIFSSDSNNYVLDGSQNELSVDLRYQDQGVEIIKRFTFTRNSHLIDIDYIILNNSPQVWRAAPYGQIRRNEYEVGESVMFGMQSYLGAAVTTDDKNYQEVSFDDIEDGEPKIVKQGGWVSMVQHYFVSAWVPNQEAKNTYNFRKQTSKDIYIMEYVGPITSVEPGQEATINSSFYAGPKDIKKLEKISPYLDLTIDYSFLSFIAKPIFYGLDFIHSKVGNWGVAIILLTLLIKIIFFYPSAMSYRSMAKMRKLQPMMADLKERFGDDKQKMSSELMKIYKKEKVNPLGGCLPILLQMPVFIALYWVLMESVELRHAPFILWITDLSVKDEFFVLPLIMGLTMFLQQKLNPTPPDPMQAKVMQMMPIFFTVLFLFFPAGLVLYWVVNNTLSIAQQYVITKQIERGESPAS
ncbi:MAG: membrane protein insertase YidC [Acidiferrobacterales bacterium]|nr:membrane protein insertase YidC [Acidiferrobacterales bacterium]